MTQRVFVDANVLYSRTLRDWLFLLRQETRGGLFQLHTTWDVIHETGARLRDDNPAADGNLLADLMVKIEKFVDEVLTAFSGGPVDGIEDEGDWHVHHAAEASRASILLTEDKRLASDGTHYEVYTCDEFFLEVARSSPDAVQRVVELQAPYWAKRGGKQLPDALRDAACPGFADVVQDHLKRMAFGESAPNASQKEEQSVALSNLGEIDDEDAGAVIPRLKEARKEAARRRRQGQG